MLKLQLVSHGIQFEFPFILLFLPAFCPVTLCVCLRGLSLCIHLLFRNDLIQYYRKCISFVTFSTPVEQSNALWKEIPAFELLAFLTLF